MRVCERAEVLGSARYSTEGVGVVAILRQEGSNRRGSNTQPAARGRAVTGGASIRSRPPGGQEQARVKFGVGGRAGTSCRLGGSESRLGRGSVWSVACWRYGTREALEMLVSEVPRVSVWSVAENESLSRAQCASVLEASLGPRAGYGPRAASSRGCVEHVVRGSGG